MKPCSVFLISNTYWSLWNFRRNLISEFIKEKYKISLIGKKDGYYSKFQNQNINLYSIFKIGAVSSIFFVMLTIFLLIWKKPQAVFSFTHLGNISAGLARKFITFEFTANLSGLGRVYSVGYKNYFFQKVLMFVLKFTLNGASTIFVQNKDDQIWLTELLPNKADLITLLPGSGTDLNWFSYCAPKSTFKSETKNILMMSRLLPQKGVDWFLMAAEELNRPSLNFTLIGEPDSKNMEMKRSVLEHSEKGLISYLGHVEDVRPHIYDAFCVVLPTRYREGTPKSLIEALACGRPVITTDMPGCRDTVERNGVLVSTYREFVDALLLIISKCENEYFVSCKNSRDLAERRFDEQIIIGHYLKKV